MIFRPQNCHFHPDAKGLPGVWVSLVSAPNYLLFLSIKYSTTWFGLARDETIHIEEIKLAAKNEWIMLKNLPSSFLGWCQTQTINVWSIFYPHLGSLEWVNKCKYSIQLVKLHPPQAEKPFSGICLVKLLCKIQVLDLFKKIICPEFMECVWGMTWGRLWSFSSLLRCSRLGRLAWTPWSLDPTEHLGDPQTTFGGLEMEWLTYHHLHSGIN